MKIKNNAPVTVGFVLACCLVLVLNAVSNNKLMPYFVTYRSSLTDPFTYIRLFSYILGHADLSHLTSNMTFILLLGPMIEEKYGSKKLLKMILITALIGSLLNTLLFSNQALCGASGIVFMMIVVSSITSVRHKEIPLTLILVFVFFIGKEIYSAIFEQDSISQLTHIAGGFCGAYFGMKK
ncbi:rhomboid family intramembrane serine protease [Floccifex sp.]|uniref:rhomboid family intramembrane serine protease n=1 Tax=Floccifex sp. TaxID=2815810 RepID=UPI002A7596D3|nr:rhomboid family intramembrane serine protease [Floccifex sp.]MDD7281206.1 rhomboid family intramembrane serine protease [Erysipelotrichaceae bacterium]MDY2958256.1 rhomboid family intramembrane serine protease [Floccifex sp.]